MRIFYSKANITDSLKNTNKWAKISIVVVIVQVLSCFPNPAEFWIWVLYFSEVNLGRRRIRVENSQTRRCTTVAVTIVKFLEDQLLNEYSLFYRKTFFPEILSYWQSANIEWAWGCSAMLSFEMVFVWLDTLFWYWHSSVMNNIWSLVTLITRSGRRLLCSYCT